MHPQVSVVIKCYNHAAYVKQSIQSILDQSFQDFELVVTDDGSTDGTADIVREFSDPRIRLEVFANNRGISNTMNATIARAQGEFVAILNSDDFALPGRLGRQVAFLTANSGVAAVFGMPLCIDERGVPLSSGEGSPGAFFKKPLMYNLQSRADWLRYFFFHFNCLCAPTAMIRREVYEQVGDYDPRLSNTQDFDMWVRVCSGHDIHVMPQELTAYRIRDDHRNMSAPRRDTMLRTPFEFSKILNRYREMSPDLLWETFAADLSAMDIPEGSPCDLWLPDLALKADSPAHRLFALETLYDVVQGEREELRLREFAGCVDVFGIWAARKRDERIEELMLEYLKLEQGNAWLEEQRLAWEKQACVGVENLQQGNAWLEQQRSAWERQAKASNAEIVRLTEILRTMS